MKKLIFSALFITTALISFHAKADDLRYKGPVTLDLTVYQSTSSSEDSITNQTGTHTNIVTKYKESAKEFTLNNEFLLRLLANSFDTNFPSGTHLVTDGFMLYVVDMTGTNIVLDISPVVTNAFSGGVNSSTYDLTEKITAQGTNDSILASGFSHGYVTLNYNDSMLTTRDGTHTIFEFDGLSTSQNSEHPSQNPDGYTESPGKIRLSFVLRGAGKGMIQGAFSVLGGSIIGSASGTVFTAIPISPVPPIPVEAHGVRD